MDIGINNVVRKYSYPIDLTSHLLIPIAN